MIIVEGTKKIVLQYEYRREKINNYCKEANYTFGTNFIHETIGSYIKGASDIRPKTFHL